MQDNKLKYRKLMISIILDLVGMVSYSLPVLAEFSDLIWAPISTYILYRLYPGQLGKIGAMTNFVEEISPGLDIIPTFTIVWFINYHILPRNKKLE